MPSSLQILVTNSFLGREDISSYLQMPRTVRTARERPARGGACGWGTLAEVWSAHGHPSRTAPPPPPHLV